jgi:regulator of RNase E activity RraA
MSVNMIEKLKQFSTPAVSDVVATFPGKNDTCLGLYNPWTTNWYTDETLKCIFPEIGPRVGYVVTVVYEMPDPNYNKFSFADVLKVVEAAPKPTVLVVKQNFPKEIKRKNGLLGGNMTACLRALGCEAILSDGPSRDIDEIRKMDIQYMLTGVCASHGTFSISAINVPVSVCGMDVAPGEIIHLDESGAIKFPADRLGEVIMLSERLEKSEIRKAANIKKSRTAEQLARAFTGADISDDEVK